MTSSPTRVADPNNTSSRSLLSVSQNSEPDDEDCYADVGFMFEGCQPSTLKRYRWVRQDSQDDEPQQDVRVALHVVDDDPGAIQSGHYMWPAAPALSEYLIETMGVQQQPSSLIELGAGCALLSLTALQLLYPSLQVIVVTDHDPGVLERAKDNYETTIEDLFDKNISEDDQLDFINDLTSIPIMFEPLEWGDERMAQVIADKAAEKYQPTAVHWHQSQIFDWVLGSDLIYCADVVEPLFTSVSHFMSNKPQSSFYLSQSFLYDTEAETAIDAMCHKFQLERIVILDTLSNNKGVKIQLFRRLPSISSPRKDHGHTIG